MSLIKKLNATLLASAIIFGTLVSFAYAANGQVKVAVPSSIITGSTITKGRKFYRSSIPENTLAGIRLGRKAKEILLRWGNPTRVTVGSSESASTAGPGVPGYVPGGAMPGIGGLPGLPGLGGIGGMAPAMPGGGAGMPPLPGMGMGGAAGMGMGAPGMPPGAGGGMGLPGMGANTANTTTSAVLNKDDITWTYDLQSGITLEFIITEGTITQITVGGVGPWGLSKTRSGIQLGDTYKLALWVYGYPETQSYSGRFLRASYVNKNRVLLTFLNKKIVGITMSMIPDDLKL